MDEIIYFFLFFGWVSLMLNSSGEGFMRKIPTPPEHLRPKEKGSVLKMENPPKPPKNCICNSIEEQSPGGRCKACHSILKMPEFPKDRIG